MPEGYGRDIDIGKPSEGLSVEKLLAMILDEMADTGPIVGEEDES